MTTNSFNKLMRSIRDKKSIKNLKVPSASERNSDGTLKEPEKKDNSGVKIVKEEQELSEALYKVSHKGHPSIKKSDGNLLFPITDGNTEYINHMTRYLKSAEDTAKLLKNKGFKDVQIHKDGKLMGESFIPKNGNKHELTIRQPNRKITGYHQSFDSREAAEQFFHKKWGADALQESVELDEGRMSELHATIGDHMDKHIATYKKIGGAESLMNHAEKAVPKIAKAHNIEPKHAEKFVSDYIESKLNESVDKSSKSDDAKLAVAKWKTMKSRAKLVIDPDKKYKSKTAKDTIKKQTFYEETEQLDEVSGALLGRYIQAARKDKSAKIEHGKELDTDPKVKELRAKISDYYSRKEYKKSGESKHRDAINKAHDNIEKRKKKIDTDYPKSVNYWKRGKGIETAIDKLKSGNLSEDTLNEVKSEPTYDHKYGLRHSIFDKKGYQITKETWHKTSAAREKYADKVSQADNFNEIISHSDPRN